MLLGKQKRTLFQPACNASATEGHTKNKKGHTLLSIQNYCNIEQMENKKTKEEKRKDWQEFVAKLKALPPEKLSKAAKWVLENEGNSENIYYDMKAVMK